MYSPPFGVKDHPATAPARTVIAMHNATDVKPDVGLFSRYDALFRRKPSNRSRPPKIFVLGGPGPSVEIARRGIQKGYADGHVPWSGVRAVACPRVALW